MLKVFHVSGAVERQDTPLELRRKILFDPTFKSFPPRDFLYLPCAANQFSQSLRGKEEVRWHLDFEPVDHTRFRLWLDCLAYNIGIEKESH